MAIARFFGGTIVEGDRPKFVVELIVDRELHPHGGGGVVLERAKDSVAAAEL